jgi:hypothetical protein
MIASLSGVYCCSLNLANTVVILVLVIYSADKEIKRHVSSPEAGILEFTDIQAKNSS